MDDKKEVVAAVDDIEAKKAMFVAATQRNLSYLFLVGYLGIKAAEGLGYFTGMTDDLKEALMVILLFWFMRERQQPTTTVTVRPAAPAGEK